MITAKPIAGALGAEIEGINLTQSLCQDDYKQIRKLIKMEKLQKISFRAVKI